MRKIQEHGDSSFGGEFEIHWLCHTDMQHVRKSMKFGWSIPGKVSIGLGAHPKGSRLTAAGDVM